MENVQTDAEIQKIVTDVVGDHLKNNRQVIEEENNPPVNLFKEELLNMPNKLKVETNEVVKTIKSDVESVKTDKNNVKKHAEEEKPTANIDNYNKNDLTTKTQKLNLFEDDLFTSEDIFKKSEDNNLSNAENIVKNKEKQSESFNTSNDIKQPKLNLFEENLFSSDDIFKKSGDGTSSKAENIVKDQKQNVSKDLIKKDILNAGNDNKQPKLNLFEDNLFSSDDIFKKSEDSTLSKAENTVKDKEKQNVPKDLTKKNIKQPKRNVFEDNLFSNDALQKVDNEISNRVKNVHTDEEIQEVITDVASKFLKSNVKKTEVEKSSLFKDDDYDDLFAETTKNKVSTSIGNTTKSSVLDTKSTETKASTNLKQPLNLNIKSDTNKSLFESPESDDDNLFRTENPKQSKGVAGSLFEDDDGLFGTRKPAVKTDNFASPIFEDDLFGDDDSNDIFSAKKLPPKSNLLKKSLFDDDADDDDIFAESSSSIGAGAVSKPSGKFLRCYH